MDKLIDLQGLRKRAELVGYAIRKDYRSSIHGLVAYATLPTKEGGGAINCFSNKRDLEHYLEQVEKNRRWESERIDAAN